LRVNELFILVNELFLLVNELFLLVNELFLLVNELVLLVNELFLLVKTIFARLRPFFERKCLFLTGLICNLFNRDEHAEIIAELTPIMRREMPKRVATPESVFNYFIQRMKQYLHVILCFSPV